MCIIAICKSGVPFPTEDTIENMWYRNPDGAGIMYTDGSGKVVIDKGYMTLKEFEARIDRLKQEIDVTAESVVLHFRIGTAGGNTPENTHPFPISKKVEMLQSLYVRSDIGVAHNGIIHIDRPIKSISDTMEYIRSNLSYLYHRQKKFYKNDKCMAEIKAEITSKMAFLLPDRSVYTIGDFITEKDGMVYSNTSYEETRYFKYGGFGSYGSYGMYSGGYFDSLFSDTRWDAYCRESSTGTGTYFEELTPLDDDFYIVDHDTGDMYECGDVGFLLIDASGMLYSLELDESSGEDYAVYVADDCTAFDPDGVEAKYDPDNTMLVEVVEQEFYILPK